MELLNLLTDSFEKNAERSAFYIDGHSHTYNHLKNCIDKIRTLINVEIPTECCAVALVTNDDIYTYAAIFALWFEGKSYVPISADSPVDRNSEILKQAGITSVIDSGGKFNLSNTHTLNSGNLNRISEKLEIKILDENQLAYIFFTSGTTGKPKGVPISFKNLSSFCEAFDNLDCTINETDRCLQMFELTFDLSVMSYLIPILKGACVYTIPKDEIKYSYIFELLEDHQLTFTLMVPSILHYLRPYFDEIECPSLKNSLFCGEALPTDVTKEWASCVPNASIINVYGPTEHTIFCTELIFNRRGSNKEYNGVLSIGKSMNGTTTIIVDDENNLVPSGEKGELCLAGDQLTQGYWKNPNKNKEVFFDKVVNGVSKRFYRTGDLCFMDDEGDIMYSGRIDFQAKIQGFRVELSEIELYAKNSLDKLNVVALAFVNGAGNTEIGLVVESNLFDTSEMIEFMKTKLPGYMIPTQIRFEPSFPLNTNGKTDRKRLTQLFV